MEIIDAHIHFYDGHHFAELALAAGHENTAAHLEREYKRLGIAGAVVMGNRDLTLAQHDYPPFMRYCVGLDRTYFDKKDLAGAVDAVEAHLGRPACVGIKLYPGYNPYYVYDDIYRPFLELAAAYQKPVAIHTGETAGEMGLLKYAHPLTLDVVATRHRDVQFVMCHWGNPWVVDAAAVMNKNPNVAADLSGLLEGRLVMEDYFARQRGYMAHLSTWLHYMSAWDRLMYGTDFPLVNMENYIAFMARLIPEQHHAAVFAQNARRIYRLDF